MEHAGDRGRLEGYWATGFTFSDRWWAHVGGHDRRWALVRPSRARVGAQVAVSDGESEIPLLLWCVFRVRERREEAGARANARAHTKRLLVVSVRVYVFV